MVNHNQDLSRARMLVQRLGRLSADSVYAHQASGVRASLDKFLIKIDCGQADLHQLEPLLKLGFEILAKAAEKIPASEES